MALGYLYVDAQLPNPPSGDPVGLRLFPALVGLGLLGSALLMLLETVRKRAAATPAPAAAPGAGRRYLVMAVAAVWALLYYAVLEHAGYLLSTTVFLFGLLLHFNPRRHVMNAAIAVGFAVVVYALFTKLLSVDLPQGILGF